ncbi:BON domain-containing protein [Gelria sp. Kuro-4]|uniref:BON domain-containing protein n=1 Tax=Gelria sp. Kuro-4 TaxID=2796927 RepID=UPI001BF185BC|nr:BON domain-containing protein [Gelria sp. Kuro-4]BCV23688.1 transporter [Gelria sp. Kuro-4]
MPERSDDDRLREEVQAELERDPQLSSYGLKADVVKGEAQLSGVVDVLAKKKRAERLARSVLGIRGVASAIAVSTDGDITDGDVESEVAEELAADPRVDARRIRARTSGGTVVLAGREEDRKAVAAAREAAARARGVTRVLDQVRTREPNPTLEEIFHSQVRNDRETEEPEHS